MVYKLGYYLSVNIGGTKGTTMIIGNIYLVVAEMTKFWSKTWKVQETAVFYGY